MDGIEIIAEKMGNVHTGDFVFIIRHMLSNTMNEDMMTGTEQGQTELKLGVDSMDIVDKKKSSLTGQPMYRMGKRTYTCLVHAEQVMTELQICP